MFKSRTAIAIVENQEQVDKIISALDQLPDLRLVVFETERGLEEYDRVKLKSLSEVRQLGQNVPREQRERLWREGINCQANKAWPVPWTSIKHPLAGPRISVRYNRGLERRTV